MLKNSNLFRPIPIPIPKPHLRYIQELSGNIDARACSKYFFESRSQVYARKNTRCLFSTPPRVEVIKNLPNTVSGVRFDTPPAVEVIENLPNTVRIVGFDTPPPVAVMEKLPNTVLVVYHGNLKVRG